MRFFRHIVFVACVLGCGPAFAVDTADFEVATTRDLVNLCSASESDPAGRQALMFCYGFVSGASHYHRELTRGPNVAAIVCPGREVPRTEIVEVFLAWSKANGDMMETPAVDGLLRAAVDKWPCS